MDTGLKQRLIGAAVLIALAVIFLPMLVKGPAPDSGATDVSLKLPDSPEGDVETKDLPLVTPGDVPRGGAVGLNTAPVDRPAAQPLPAQPANGAPAVDPATGQPAVATPAGSSPTATTSTTTAATTPAAATPAAATPAAATPATAAPALPATTAGGNFVVHFGAYASQKGADTVAAAVKAAQLPAYTEATTVGGKPAFRVRIGPYATRAEAESVRLKALEVRSDVPVRVVALDAEPAPAPAATATPVAPAVDTAKPVAKPADAKPVDTKPADTKPQTPAKPAEQKPAPAKPVEPKPQVAAATAPKPAAPKPAPATPKPAAAPPAAAKVGFAVQVGAFSDATEAGAMRERLRAAGFSAFTDTVTTDAGKLTRVRVGPVLDRAAADQLKAQIQAKTGVDGIVRPHP